MLEYNGNTIFKANYTKVHHECMINKRIIFTLILLIAVILIISYADFYNSLTPKSTNCIGFNGYGPCEVTNLTIKGVVTISFESKTIDTEYNLRLACTSGDYPSLPKAHFFEAGSANILESGEKGIATLQCYDSNNNTMNNLNKANQYVLKIWTNYTLLNASNVYYVKEANEFVTNLS